MRAIFGAAIALAMLAAGPAAAQTKITISYGPGYPWIPAFVAKDQGIFARHGLDVNLQFIAIGSNQPAALIAGTSQIAGLNPTIVLFADEGGADLQIVAGANGQAKTGSSGGAIARAGLAIKSPADYRGKKIGVPGLQSVIHIAFMKWLKDRGVDPSAVTFIEVPINQMNDALKNSQIDIALPAAPFTDQILKAGTGTLVTDYQAELADPVTIYSAWAMTRAYKAAHPEVAPAFKQSLREAIDFIGTNEKEARKTLVTYLHLPEPVAMSV
ncbi:MAG TPA: ABC transporter substrate-binding protein, partial [Stellaceae bacterium]|nr:ABC transporter substrate-binding protein [Stellaceae bacterium]